MTLSPDTNVSFEAFRRSELDKETKIRAYAYDARKNYVKLHYETVHGFTRRGQRDWAAVNATARIKVTEVILGGLDSISPEDRQRWPCVRTAVLASESWLTDLDHAHDFDVSAIKGEVTERFAGINFVGAMEPGYYPRWHLPGEKPRPIVSWHVHLVLWGTTPMDMGHAVIAHRERHRGTLFGVPAATTTRRSWKSAPKHIAYALKTPAKSYTTRRIQERVNPATGEIKPEHDRQLAQALRPGEHVKMRNVLRPFTLDDLLLAGGAGVDLVRPVLARMERDRFGFS